MHRLACFSTMPLVFVFALLLGAGCGAAQPVEGSTGEPAAVAAEPSATPAEVTTEHVAAGIDPGEYLLDAYVLELRPCPACPPPLSCKPCVGEHVVVHDQAAPPPNASTPMLRLKPGEIERLQVGERYRFLVRTVGQASNVSHIEVTSATVLP